MAKKSADKHDPEKAAEWVAVADLEPWQDNPRKNDRAVDEVAASIKRFGFAAPIVARRADRMVIAGHTRLKAAQKLGLDRVPVRFVDLDPADAKLLALADNKLGEIAEWDDELLAKVLGEFDEAQLEGVGFDAAEIARTLGDDGAIDDDAPASLDMDEHVGFSLVVTCDSDEAQRKLAERLEAEGFKCRLLML